MVQVPYTVIAQYPYTPEAENAVDDLAFGTGQLITVTEVVDDDWLYGSYKDLKTGDILSGYFPKSFVETKKEEEEKEEKEEEKEEKEEEEKEEKEEEKEEKKEEKEDQVKEEKVNEVNNEAENEFNDSIPEQEVSKQKEAVKTAAEPQITKKEEKLNDLNEKEPDSDKITSSPITKAALKEPITKASGFKDKINAFNDVSAPPPIPGKVPEESFVQKRYVAPSSSSVEVLTAAERDIIARRKQALREKQRAEQQKLEVVKSRETEQQQEAEEEKEEAVPKMTLKERLKMLEERQKQDEEALAAAMKRREEKKRQREKKKEEEESKKAEIADAENVDDVEELSEETKQQEMVGGEGKNEEGDKEEGKEKYDDEIADEGSDKEANAENAMEEHRIDENADENEKEENGDDEEEEEEENENEEEEEEEEDDDEELRRRRLRERMAKLSGGMGMMGMLGLGGASPVEPKKSKKKTKTNKHAGEKQKETSTLPEAVPVFPFAKGSPFPLKKPLDVEEEKEPLENASVEEGERAKEDVEKHPYTEQNLDAAAPPASEHPYTTTSSATSAPPPPIPTSGISAPPPVPAVIPNIPPTPTRSAPPPIPGSVPVTQEVKTEDSVEKTKLAGSSSLQPPPPVPGSRPEPPEPTGTIMNTPPVPKASTLPPLPEAALKNKQSLTNADSSERAATSLQYSTLSHSQTPSLPRSHLPPPPPPPVPQTEAPPVRNSQLFASSSSSSQSPVPEFEPATAAQMDDLQPEIPAAQPDYPPEPRSIPFTAPPPPPPTVPVASRALEAGGIAAGTAPAQLQPRRTTSTDFAPRRNSLFSLDRVLAHRSHSDTWYTKGELPKQLKDAEVYFEVEKHEISKRYGRTVVYVDYYLLNKDLSSRLWELSFEKNDASTLLGWHGFSFEKPKPDIGALVRFSESLGSKAYRVAASSLNMDFDGQPDGLVSHVISQLPSSVVPPVAGKTFGATIYRNNDNIDIRKIEQIRPGDIFVVVKGRFEGKSSRLIRTKKVHELGFDGRPYVGFVASFDEQKMKLKVIEQTNNSVGVGSYRLGDFKSGKIRVFRFVERPYIGW
ncbi:DEBR0S4_02278g1_1 [Brettanomyces bruxellensis]|uniref:DEBR0S4_02278g1_1 n=1 Tax=Dekkera bruxellensis TaxID=5007 RepID=A0A7D9H2X6_DEKBR|nr:DEBR0S4_02278g1_1 [Brettanomyces bruxellensis]